MDDIFRVYADALNVAPMQPLPTKPGNAVVAWPETRRPAGTFAKFAAWRVRRAPLKANPSLSGGG